jgi:hypothetical protein
MNAEWFGYNDYSEEEMMRAMWDDDGPVTLEDENLAWIHFNRSVSLVGRGGSLVAFEPDADLDAALVEAYTKVMGA